MWHRIYTGFVVLLALKFPFNCYLTSHFALLEPRCRGPLAVIARCDYVYLLSPVCDKGGAAYVCIMQSALSLCKCKCVETALLSSRGAEAASTGTREREEERRQRGNKSRNIFCPNDATPCC